MSNEETIVQDHGVSANSTFTSGSVGFSKADSGYLLIQILNCPNLSDGLRHEVESKLSKLLDELT